MNIYAQTIRLIIVTSLQYLVGFLLCPSQLSNQGATDLWKQALQDGFVIPLIRDKVFFIFGAFDGILSSSKDKKYNGGVH